jgi:hypothetical protein
MKKILYFTVLIGFMFLAGCGDDDENTTNVCKLTSLNGFDDGGVNFKLNYGSDEKLSSVAITLEDNGFEITAIYTATYTGNNLTKLALPGNLQVFTFTYDGNDRITRVDFIDEDEFTERTEFQYNSNGQVIKVESSSRVDSEPFVKEGYSTYEYSTAASRNPQSVTEFSYDGETAFETGTSEFEYDDKKSVASSSPVFAAVLGFLGENNVTRETHTSVIENSYVVVYSYQYNAQGYPTLVTEKYGDDPATSITLTYDCQ